MDDVKSLYKGNLGVEHDQVFRDIIIPATGRDFAQYCVVPDFDKAERTKFFSPRENQRILNLPPAPIAATPAIQIWQDTSRAFAASTLLVENTDYVVNHEEGTVERINGCFARGLNTVKVTWTGGYLTNHEVGTPEDLRIAAIIHSKVLFDRREEWALSARSLEGAAVTIIPVQKIFLPQVEQRLNQYRFWSVS